jgi:hypothetical protein
MPDFLCELTRCFLNYYWQILLVTFAESCLLAVHNAESNRGQREIGQPFEKKIMDRPVITERNVVQSDIMVAPLDSIQDTIQTYHWGYLHNCTCVVYTRLVRLFYANLEVVQNDDRGVVLQSTVDGHTIIVDP